MDVSVGAVVQNLLLEFLSPFLLLLVDPRLVYLRVVLRFDVVVRTAFRKLVEVLLERGIFFQGLFRDLGITC